jgi:hypothetical protein
VRVNLIFVSLEELSEYFYCLNGNTCAVSGALATLTERALVTLGREFHRDMEFQGAFITAEAQGPFAVLSFSLCFQDNLLIHVVLVLANFLQAFSRI